MITKEKILEKVGGEEYLIRHLVPSFDTNIRKKNYKSIFSEKDSRPSMSIYEEGSTWKFKSFNTGHQGDAFRMWADKYGLDCQTQFPALLELINQEMCLGLETSQMERKVYQPVVVAKEEKKEESTSLPSQTLSISYIPYGDSDLSKLHLKYWSQYGIDQSILEHFNVHQVDYLGYTSNTGRRLSFKYKEQSKIVSAFEVSKKVKIYIPSIPSNFSNSKTFSGQKKSFCYSNRTGQDVFGLPQLARGTLDYILLTAGEKDAMSAYAHGYKHVVSLHSETQLPSVALLEKLRKQSKCLLSCYDNDKTGKTASQKLEMEFGIPSIPLPEGVKDISDYFQEYSSADFQVLLEEGKSRSIALSDLETPSIRKGSLSTRGKIEAHLSKKFEFRYNTVALEREIRVRGTTEWEQVNMDELRGHLDRHSLNCPSDLISSIMKSFFVGHYNPVKSFFSNASHPLYKEDNDYIFLLANYVALKNSTPSLVYYFYNHLKKWMIRAARCAAESGQANKHGLFFCSPKENIGKSYFCEFLCPPVLLQYMNTNPIIGNDKDAQKALISNFLIILDDMAQLKSNNGAILKAWFSQRWVKVRLPYHEDDTLAPRIASFLGSTNDMSFLKSDMGYSRWIAFEIDDTQFLGKEETHVRDMAWLQAINLYLADPKSGELTKEELADLEHQSSHFKESSSEKELLEQYISSSTKEEEGSEFMTTTDILRFLQQIVSLDLRLNTKKLGTALRELGFNRIVYKKKYGYWISKNTTIC